MSNNSPNTNSGIPPDDLETINNIIQESLERYKVPPTTPPSSSEYMEILSRVQNLLTEYFGDFIVIGHTLDEERVVMKYAPTPIRFDSLQSLSRDYFIATGVNNVFIGSGGVPPTFNGDD